MIGIVGGTGLVGSALARELEQNPNILFKIASRTPPKPAEQRARWTKVDLADGMGLGNFLGDTRQVVHLAWSQQPLVSIGGTWRLAYRSAQYNIPHLLFLFPAPLQKPFENQIHYRKEALLLLRQSGVPLTLIESQPSYEWLLSYCQTLSGVPIQAIPDGKKIAPLPLTRIASAIAAQLNGEIGVQGISLKGEETLSLRQILQIYRKSGHTPTEPARHEPPATWENFLAQNLHRSP